MSPYFSKEAIFHTWSGEIYGFGIAGEFTQLNDHVMLIPDPSKLREKKPGRRGTRRIRNDMDESEAGGKTKRCSRCDKNGHTYKYCPKNKQNPVQLRKDFQDLQQMELALRARVQLHDVLVQGVLERGGRDGKLRYPGRRAGPLVFVGKMEGFSACGRVIVARL